MYYEKYRWNDLLHLCMTLFSDFFYVTNLERVMSQSGSAPSEFYMFLSELTTLFSRSHVDVEMPELFN